MKEPYFINVERSYDDIYNFENRKIIIGITANYSGNIEDIPTMFSSELISFEIKPSETKRKIYDIKYENIEKDEITISVYNSINNEKKYQLIFESEGENWKMKN